MRSAALRVHAVKYLCVRQRVAHRDVCGLRVWLRRDAVVRVRVLARVHVIQHDGACGVCATFECRPCTLLTLG